MKNLILLSPFLYLLFLVVFAIPVSASEGTALLTGPSDSRCYLVSVLIDEGRYKILASCRNLTVPPQAETLFYRLWGKRLNVASPAAGLKISPLGRGVYLSFGDITSGKLTSETRQPFDQVIVTIEKQFKPAAPNLAGIILSGAIQPIDYGPDFIGAGETIEPTAPLAKVTLEPALSPTPVAAAGKSIVGVAFKIFLVVVLVIVTVAVIISIVQRRSAAK